MPPLPPFVIHSSSKEAMMESDPALPPSLQPPPPLQAPSAEQRLHPLTLLISTIRVLRGFLIPAIFVIATGNASIAPFLLSILGLSLLNSFIRYFTFSYRIQNGELVTRQGLLSRQERNIPLHRVQDLRLEAGLLHRMLRVVDVQVETAGGKGVEAELSVLSRETAANLRHAIFSHPTHQESPSPATETPDNTLVQLGWRELILEGLTSNRAASLLVLIGAAAGFADDLIPQSTIQDWLSRLGPQAEEWLSHNHQLQWKPILLLAAILTLASVAFSIAGSIILFHNFTLKRRGNDLFRTYGLLTRRTSNLPRHRIQLLVVEEPLVRRVLKLARIRADTATQRSNNQEEQKGGRDVLIPLARKSDLPRLLPELSNDLHPLPGHWTQVAPCAVSRANKKSTLAILSLAIILAAGPLQFISTIPPLHAFWLLTLIPITRWINRRAYQHLGFADTQSAFHTRRGWLNRITHSVPVRNLQVVTLHQNPWDRHHDVYTLRIDTAGQSYAGHAPMLRNIPAHTASSLAASLARRASQTRYQT